MKKSSHEFPILLPKNRKPGKRDKWEKGGKTLNSEIPNMGKSEVPINLPAEIF